MESLKKIAQNLSSRAFENHSLSNQNAPPCSLCNDTGTELIAGAGRLCECVREKDRQKRIARKAELIARIDPLYAGVTLAGLEARPDLHSDQARHIRTMQEHPFDNYYLCGANDTGKTRMMWALYENAVSAGRRVMAGTLFDMLEEIKAGYRKYERDEPRPDMLGFTKLQILGTSQPYSAFIDDIDKARPTEFAAEFFFSYIDALYRYNHQIVVTSQLDPEKRVDGRDSLIDHFEKADPRYAVGIVRRLVNDQTRIVRMN